MKATFRRFKYLFLLLIILFFLYILGLQLIKNSNLNVFFKIKSIIPNSLKHYAKNTIFIIPSLKKKITELNAIIELQKESLNRKNQTLEEISNKFFSKGYPIIPFKIKTKRENYPNLAIASLYVVTSGSGIIETKYSKYLLTIFQTDYLYNGKAHDASASGYIEEYNDKILIGSGDGIFLYFYKNDLNKKNFNSQTIPTNIKEIIKYSNFYSKSKFGIKDILVNDDKLYISYSNQLTTDCFNTAILVADINFEYLNFDKFFTPNQCVNVKNDYGDFNAHIAGGRIVNFKNNKLLFSTGAFHYSEHAQNDKSVFGKIISIDKTNSNWVIISKGHRNIQGLKYDNEKDIIFSTEHGPTGGDEFNINFNPNINNVKNYGWPISSYGEHCCGGKIEKNKFRYERAPLHKSHEKYGFVEPIKYYVPSIGISEIEKIPKKFNKEFDNDFFISAMGNNREEGDLSIHHIKLDKNFKKILKEDIIVIGERIRDLKYIESLNKIILFIENSPGIGVLSYSINQNINNEKN